MTIESSSNEGSYDANAAFQEQAQILDAIKKIYPDASGNFDWSSSDDWTCMKIHGCPAVLSITSGTNQAGDGISHDLLLNSTFFDRLTDVERTRAIETSVQVAVEFVQSHLLN